MVSKQHAMTMAPGGVRAGRVEVRQSVRRVSRGGYLERRCACRTAPKRGEIKTDVGRKRGGVVSTTNAYIEGACTCAGFAVV